VSPAASRPPLYHNGVPFGPVSSEVASERFPDGVRSDLELLDTQRFASGAVYLRYCLQSA
jgi:hypothetical protein